MFKHHMFQTDTRLRICLVFFLCQILAGTCFASNTEKLVAITFDDGPTPEVTEQLLAGLAERQVKATFFLCGYRIAQFPEIPADIDAMGHEIGLHGYSHTYLHDANLQTVQQELDQTEELLIQITGKATHLFRPPGGLIGDAVHSEAEARGLAMILWSVDPQDWCCHRSDTIVQCIVNHVSDGDIILLHDLSACSVQAALSAIDILQKDGYTFVTVSELAELRGNPLTPGQRYYCFPKSAAK